MALNYGDLQNFITQEIKRILNSWKEEQNQQGNQAVKDEMNKLVQQLEQRGFNKEKLLIYLKEIWEPTDFDEKNKYKGGIALIIKTIEDKLIPYATKKEVETKLTEAETKTTTALKPYKDWENTKKDLKPELDKYVINETKVEGIILKQIQKIFGEDKFNPNIPGKDVPAGREGMYKDPVAIAIMEQDAKKQAEAVKDWDKFFDEDHGITISQEKEWWMKQYPANPKRAEKVYTDAIDEATELVPDKTLTKKEKDKIIFATMPDKIKEVVADIPLERKRGEWRDFFVSHEEIKQEWQKSWIGSGLTITQADTAYKNGWRNDPNKGVIKNSLITEYVVSQIIKDKELKKTARNIKPLEHSAAEVEKALNFIIKEIKAQTDLNKFPIDNNINGAYDDSKVPDTLSHGEVKTYRDGAIVALFKQYFQGEQASKLDDKQIEEWRLGKTGLPNTGKDQRIAYDNGWENPTEIKDGKSNHKGVQNIDVLITKQIDIDNEIVKVDDWVNKIEGYTKMRQLDQNLTEINKVVSELKEPLLPTGKKGDLTTAIQKAKDTLLYYANDPADGGFEVRQLQTYENSVKDEWKPRKYASMNTKILSKFIKATEGVELVKDSKWQGGNINEWLKSLGAYEITKKLKDKEELLPLAKRGEFLLPFSFEKVRIIGDYELKNFDDLEKNGFCQAEMVEESMYAGLVKKKIPQIKGTQGHFPFPTGSGKSTKVVACIKRGGEIDGVSGKAENRNIILVMPEQVLVESIYNNHNGWCQTWGCVICKVDGGRIKVKKGTFDPASDEDIRKGNYDEEDVWKSHGKYEVLKNKIPTLKERQEGKTFLSIITGDELIGYMARQLLVDRKYVVEDLLIKDLKSEEIENSVDNPLDDWQPDPKDPEWTAEKLAEYKRIINERLILKDKDVLLFDEGHWKIGRFQRIQAWMTYLRYKVIRMSATFEGQQFSISSTYHRDNVYVGGKELDPNLVMGERNGKKITLDELLRTDKTWFFAPSVELTDKQIKALWDDDLNLPVPYIAYTNVWDPYAESMSYGMPPGSFSIVPTHYGVGQTPDAGLVIPSGKIYVQKLDEKFSYGKPDLREMPQDDGLQMIGRTGRWRNGFALFLSLVLKAYKAKDDVESAMVDGMFDGQMKHIIKKDYKMLYDANMLRMALALPKKFGSPPAEILIGLKVDEKNEEKRTDNNDKYWQYKGTDKEASKGYKYQPLTKINWRTENEPQKDGLIAKVDKGLWARYLGKEEKPVMDKNEAKARLLQAINTFIKNDRNFPQNVKVKNQSNLIEYIWGELLSKKDAKTGKETLSADTIAKNKAGIITEIKQVLNGVVNKEIDGYKERGEYDFNKKTSKDKGTIEQIANYYKMSDATIDILMMPKVGEENKQVLTLRIEK